MKYLVMLVLVIVLVSCGSGSESGYKYSSYPTQEITFGIGTYIGVTQATVVFPDKSIKDMHLLIAGGTTVPIYLFVKPDNAEIGDHVNIKALCYVLGPNDFEQVDTSAVVVINGLSYAAYTPTKGKQPTTN